MVSSRSPGMEDVDTAIIDIMVKEAIGDSVSVNNQLINEMKQTVQAELKVVCTLIGGLKDKISTIVEQVNEVRCVHTKCIENTNDYRSKMIDKINGMQIEINELKFKDIDKTKFESLQEKCIKMEQTIDALKRWLWILATATATMLIKIVLGLVVKI
jgi:SMC interacting uncharacterized protein involved in chromosome segregation